MTDPIAPKDDLQQLAELDARIKAAKGEDKVDPKSGKDFNGAEMGWRMVIELVTGICLGGGIGYMIDHYAGTMPFGLITFIFLGFAAGVKTMLNTARAYQKSSSETSEHMK